MDSTDAEEGEGDRYRVWDWEGIERGIGRRIGIRRGMGRGIEIFKERLRQILIEMLSSVRQTDSALFNLSLNIHRHLEVPKSKKIIEKNNVRQL